MSDLASTLRTNGLELLGSFNVEEAECLLPDRTHQPHAVLIIGNVGSAVWPFFETARREHHDLSLDSWTEEIVGKIAAEFDLEAVYPFGGPPFHPFIRWAKRTGILFSSPIGLTIHPDYGLWLAFRAALLLDQPLDRECPIARHPCDDCEDRPCLTTCPVGAFTEDGYDFEACLNQVASPSNACREDGCLARIACPVGQQYRYERPHAAFHMQQLLKAHGKA